MRREEMLVSPELQEIIDSTFYNEYKDGGGNGDEGKEAELPALKPKTHYIQMSSVQVETVNEAEADCYYSNNGNSVIFRETTV